MIKLKSNDDQIFEVDEKVARMSVTINTLLQDLGTTDDEPVPLPNVSAAILRLVLKWAEHHKDDPKIPEEDEDRGERRHSDEIPPWDAEFFTVDQSILFDIIQAANYLDIKSLLDVSCQTVANMIKGKTPEEIRQLFDIENDFSPEEEERVRRESEWLEEK